MGCAAQLQHRCRAAHQVLLLHSLKHSEQDACAVDGTVWARPLLMYLKEGMDGRTAQVRHDCLDR